MFASAALSHSDSSTVASAEGSRMDDLGYCGGDGDDGEADTRTHKYKTTQVSCACEGHNVIY